MEIKDDEGEKGGREKRTEGEGRGDRKGRGGALHEKRTGIEGMSSSAPSRLMTHQALSRLIKVAHTCVAAVKSFTRNPSTGSRVASQNTYWFV